MLLSSSVLQHRQTNGDWGMCRTVVILVRIVRCFPERGSKTALVDLRFVLRSGTALRCLSPPRFPSPHVPNRLFSCHALLFASLFVEFMSVLLWVCGK